MIRGITFKNQDVRPEDDGRLYSSIFNDGVLHGCSFSFAGYTLTLSPGYLIAAGRLIKVSAAQNYACNGASEGFARLILTIDLSKIASNILFEQIKPELEYSLSNAGFSDLTQQDINNGISTVYQLELARVSLSSGGITAITDHLKTATYKEVLNELSGN